MLSLTGRLGRRRLRETCAPACKSRKARMPRYFFHVIDGIETIDSEGTVLADVEEARAEAIVLSGAMLRDSGGKFWNNGQWQLRVVDATGNKVCALTFSAAVTAFLEAMLGVVPRLGVSLALIIAHEDQRPALALLLQVGV